MPSRSPHPPKIIAFDAGHLLERGTDVALYDYAHFSETLLGHRALILCPAAADISCLDKFRLRFPVCLYRGAWDLEYLLQGVDLYYRIVHGRPSAEALVRPPGGKLAIHAVFDAGQPYGDIFAAVSSWVAKERGIPGREESVAVVPHMLHLPAEEGDLRAEFAIPAEATVLGRHGGLETFNIPWAQEVVRRVLMLRQDLYFLFLNTRPFVEHERAIFLPATPDMQFKTRFINSCDGMLHARSEGETFGLSVGEFSIRNRPVITWLDSYDKHHIQVLGQKGIYYQTPEDLLQILLQFRPATGEGDFDAFSEHFAPEPVMRAFAEVFLGEGAQEPTRLVPRQRYQLRGSPAIPSPPPSPSPSPSPLP